MEYSEEKQSGSKTADSETGEKADEKELSEELLILVKEFYIAEAKREEDGFSICFSDGRTFRIRVSEVR